MTWLKRILILGIMAIMPMVNIFAATGNFVVRKIKVEGLQRISYGTVLSYLPVKPGETLTPEETSDIITSLYNTGFFSNVQLSRDGNDLIINVVERPTIGAINISGNKKIPTKKLQEVLNNIGIAEGNAFDRSTLQALQESLQQQYFNLGQYNAKVNTTVTQESRNRVAVNINIDEGHPARIKEITIIGNTAFSHRKLVGQFKETTWRPWTFFTHTDQYSRDKLDADLETMRSYYMDRGYLRFKIDSTNVKLSPDNKSVYITITITEGPIYRIKGFTLTGDLKGQNAAELEKQIPLKPGEIFSRAKIIDIDNALTHLYGNQGYAFASVNPNPEIDDVNHEVFINFNIQPGQRVYVRRITFTGNTKTQDIVLRREMRQEEGGLYSLSNIEEGKRRLMLLGYLQNAQPTTTPVPGQPDQVDVNYNVNENSSATASLQVGYSDMYGLLYGANVTENNLMGTGKQVGVAFENSQYSSVYSVNYTNPYYTESGISRAISAFYQHVTPGNVGIAQYSTNVMGGSVSYGFPISEYSGLSFGYGYQNIALSVGSTPSLQIAQFINQHGTHFNQFALDGGWQRTTYDRAWLPTRGSKQQISVEVGAPLAGNSLEYYQINYQVGMYHPLVKNFLIYLDGDLGYANGYGGFNNDFPFFKNYFAGGPGSVRGFSANTLGPLDSDFNPIGGNVLTTGTASLVVPNPWSDKLRTSIFLDGGNVFNNQFAANQLRFSTGIDVQWYIPMMGPLDVSLGFPLNSRAEDQKQPFGFNVGTSF